MCIKCNWTRDEWILHIKEKLEQALKKYPIFFEPTLVSFCGTKTENRLVEEINGVSFRFCYPASWATKESYGWFFRITPNEHFDVEVYHAIEQLCKEVMIWVGNLLNDSELKTMKKTTYLMEPPDYLGELHPHRRELFFWSQFGDIGSLDTTTECGFCHDGYEYNTIDIDDIEQNNFPDGTFGYGTAYMPTASVQHASGWGAPGDYSCWRFFASRCMVCGYHVWQMNNAPPEDGDPFVELQQYPERNCLACHYFLKVLNEYCEATEVLHDSIFGMESRPTIQKRQWPFRVGGGTKVTDFNALDKDLQLDLILQEREHLIPDMWEEANMQLFQGTGMTFEEMFPSSEEKMDDK